MTIAQEHSFSFSPPQSNSPPDDTESALGSLGLYDEDSKDGLFDEDKPRKTTGRKGPGPVAADKRATHNAIERARRESLNGRFMVSPFFCCPSQSFLALESTGKRPFKFFSETQSRSGTDRCPGPTDSCRSAPFDGQR